MKLSEKYLPLKRMRLKQSNLSLIDIYKESGTSSLFRCKKTMGLNHLMVMRYVVNQPLSAYIQMNIYGDNPLQRTFYGKMIKNMDYQMGRVNQYMVRNNYP